MTKKQSNKLSQLFKEFIASEKTGGLLLIFCTALSLIIANNTMGESYHHFWLQDIGTGTLEYWINDGLMAIFFLLIGLELEREIYIGELSKLKNALLPMFGALGGMVVPAFLYLALNAGTDTQSGAGIPMATDIAFALGVLSLLGKSVPVSIKIFLTALAVIDDLGAILVIAIFYSGDLLLTNLFISLGIWVVLLLLNRLRVRNLIPYLIGGVAMWWFMLYSGVHATITGVLLAFAIPFGNGDKKSISYRLQHFLHAPVAFIILPLFALANTAIEIKGGLMSLLQERYSLGIALGLIVGKPVGILSFAFLSVKLKICQLPQDINWKLVAGTGLLGGIGFTMSIFISLLAFDNSEVINQSKLSILLSSVIAGTIGFVFLKYALQKKLTLNWSHL